MTHEGVVFLDSEQTALLRCLDATFESWGISGDAESVIGPALLPVADLARLGYYESFPNQALVVNALDVTKPLVAPDTVSSFSPEQLQVTELALPSAACYAVYLGLAGTTLAENKLVTLVGRCFRREEGYSQLRRMLGFHMREVVALGPMEFTQSHIDQYSELILAFGQALDLPIHKEPATDPFFDSNSARAFMQRVVPVKHEFIVDDIAVASVNKHRNFFGERCSINLAETGTPVFTSCAAFGLERWISVLTNHYGGCAAAIDAVRKAEQSVTNLVGREA
jgi:hypothetical protein